MEIGNLNLTLKINDVELDVTSEEVSFSLVDNIYTLHNTAQIQLSDEFGFMKESLLLEKGNKVNLSVDYNENKTKLSYRIEQANSNKSPALNHTGAIQELVLVNDFKYSSPARSKSYKGSLSTIIKNIVASRFSETRIASTSNSGIWLQGLKTDSQFLLSLQKIAWSQNASNTPFLMFIDNTDKFNFLPFNDIWTKKPIKELKRTGDTSIVDGSSMDSSVMYTIQYLDRPLQKVQSVLNANFYQFDKNGNFKTETIKYKDKTGQPLGNLPVNNEIDSNLRTILGLFERDNNKEDNLGRKTQYLLEAYTLERYALQVPLDLNLKSGEVVDLLVGAIDGVDEISKRVSGKYVIEMSRHVYNGAKKTGFTQLIIGRRDIPKLSSDYKLKERLS